MKIWNWAFLLGRQASMRQTEHLDDWSWCGHAKPSAVEINYFTHEQNDSMLIKLKQSAKKRSEQDWL